MFQRLLPYLLLSLALCVGAAILSPSVNRSPLHARRVNCQLNLKQIGLAVAQYAQDYDDHLPPCHWASVLLPYMKTEQLFCCPETNYTPGTTDYFWNARFAGTEQSKISHPPTLILLGDGQDDAPLDATLSSLPESWRRNENSPAWRHLETANYGFADGHVKALRVNRVTRDLRLGVAK